MYRRNQIFDNFFLLPFVRIWLVFLLVLSFTDHDHYNFIGNDYKSAVVKSIVYDHIDFPVSLFPEDTRLNFEFKKHIALINLERFNLKALLSMGIPLRLNNRQNLPPIVSREIIFKNGP